MLLSPSELSKQIKNNVHINNSPQHKATNFHSILSRHHKSVLCFITIYNIGFPMALTIERVGRLENTFVPTCEPRGLM